LKGETFGCKTKRLHIHFYEGDLSPERFKNRFEKVVEVVERAKKIVLRY